MAGGEDGGDVGDEEKTWVHRLRSLVLDDASGEPELLVLILSDATEWANSEEATIEKKLAQAGLAKSQIAVLEKYSGWRRRAIGLLWAYLYRIDMGNDKLENGTAIPDQYLWACY